MAAFLLGAVKERNNLLLWSILWSGVEEVIVLLGRENHNP
jgi:hypothetical protein